MRHRFRADEPYTALLAQSWLNRTRLRSCLNSGAFPAVPHRRVAPVLLLHLAHFPGKMPAYLQVVESLHSIRVNCSRHSTLEALSREGAAKEGCVAPILNSQPSHRPSVKAKKSGWNGSLALSLDRGVKKEFQTNRIKAQCTRTALQSHSAASGL